MLHFSKWKTIAILLTVLAACLLAAFNFVPAHFVARWPQLARRRIVLGLDLQGGSYLLLEVDRQSVKNEAIQALRDDIVRILRQDRVASSSVIANADGVQIDLRNTADLDKARSALHPLVQPIGGLGGRSGEHTVDISQAGADTIRASPSEAAINERIRQAVGQSIDIIQRRINALGTVEPIVESQGSDQIQVEVPGLQNPARLKTLIGKTAKLTFRLIDTSVSPDQALAGETPPDSEVLYGTHKPPRPYLVEKHVAVSGADLTDAQASFDSQTGMPIVTFRLGSEGARRFAEVTSDNVGRPFAIVLDDQVISAPVIREPIVGGSGEISGDFTVEEANDLAVLLRAGALPAKLTIIAERTVGPGLGRDSIRSGEMAAVAGAALVALFMLMTYGLFGVFAIIAVAVNVIMIFGVLSLLNATLTLPGIAGIVLTVGIAVDSNVLSYERIREEFHHGRTAINAIDAGFKRSLATILDSNITTFIAAIVLFFIGTGPVRGFAVTLGVGIVTTLFTAFTLTRLIIAWWVFSAKPKTIPI
ncbi:MAG TPA: protein translocase subunit SecD [Bradyrhizobium sp.]|nr:protein translocase subunit SecD [Bradyrhizobium sp.]